VTLASLMPLGVDLILTVGLLTILVVDLILPPGDKRILGWGTLGVFLSALAGTLLLDLNGPALGGTYVGSSLATFFKVIFLSAGALAVLASFTELAEKHPRRQGEYYLLLMSSVLGMTLLAGAQDLVLLVVSFELMGIPLYALAAWDKREKQGIEGALKLYLVGAISSIFILFGLSMVFGLAGTSSIPQVAAYAASHPSPAALLGGTLALAGMGFKIGVFPFHMWVPDTYEGAPTPFVSFLSVAPKAAGLAALVQLLLAGDQALLQLVLWAVLALAAVTMVAGNLLAVNQSNVKRLLGYSGVGHIGFLLLAIGTGTELGLATLLFYLAGYLFTNVGAFLIIHAVARSGGDDTIASFDGLGRRNGWLGMAMLLFLLSLAGIPFVVGFWAKLFVFLAAWVAGYAPLVVLGALVSVLGLFYYLRVVRAMYMQPVSNPAPVEVDAPTNLAIAICLGFVVGMGVVPRPFMDAAMDAATRFLAG
jgi:NADH-quinone oxidoreductase subunit N